MQVDKVLFFKFIALKKKFFFSYIFKTNFEIMHILIKLLAKKNIYTENLIIFEKIINIFF